MNEGWIKEVKQLTVKSVLKIKTKNPKQKDKKHKNVTRTTKCYGHAMFLKKLTFSGRDQRMAQDAPWRHSDNVKRVESPRKK